MLTDFIEYNDFLEVCDAAVVELDLEGELQMASFHPQYQFAGSQPDDIENYTNRSPYPMLHLLREASVERAVAAVGDATRSTAEISARCATSGNAGWRRLWRD